MSRTLATNCGSLESLNVSARCGCSPNAFQIRCTAVWLRPTSAAIDRVDQCVAFVGADSSVLVITSSTFASEISPTTVWWSSSTRTRRASGWSPTGGRPATRRASVMIALRRVDVADLNARARARMRAAGALGADELELRAGGFSVGDHVLVRQNHLGLGISNGQRGVVARVDIAERRLELDVDRRRVRLGPDFLDASTRHGDPTLTHGYAITGHAAQGTTVDRAFVLADPSLTQEWGYTALTRGRESNHLYLAADRALWRDEFAPHDPAPPDPIAQLARALSKSNAQTLAIDASPLIAAQQELRRLESARRGGRARSVRGIAPAARPRGSRLALAPEGAQ